MNPFFDNIQHYFKIVLTTGMSMMICWKVFAWKGLVLLFPIWILWEVTYRLRLRKAIVCSFCGFDPYLFLSDQSKSIQVVKEHWEKKHPPRAEKVPESPPLNSKGS